MKLLKEFRTVIEANYEVGGLYIRHKNDEELEHHKIFLSYDDSKTYMLCKVDSYFHCYECSGDNWDEVAEFKTYEELEKFLEDYTDEAVKKNVGMSVHATKDGHMCVENALTDSFLNLYGHRLNIMYKDHQRPWIIPGVDLPQEVYDRIDNEVDEKMYNALKDAFNGKNEVYTPNLEIFKPDLDKPLPLNVCATTLSFINTVGKVKHYDPIPLNGIRKGNVVLSGVDISKVFEPLGVNTTTLEYTGGEASVVNLPHVDKKVLVHKDGKLQVFSGITPISSKPKVLVDKNGNVVNESIHSMLDKFIHLVEKEYGGKNGKN
ncbi:MAG: hypothetical protein ACRC92_04150 [Peptostreptococcaceae bacterium]